MLKLPPPVWTLIFLIVAAALSFALGWPKVPGLPFPPLGIALVVIAFIPPVWAAWLFRREGTEIDPTSPTNRALVTRGPYRLTRNPMYLGLITLALHRHLGRRLADVSCADRGLRNHHLRAHSVRGSEDAPPVRRRLRRVCWAGGTLAVRVGPASAQATMHPEVRQRKPVDMRDLRRGRPELGSCLTDATRGGSRPAKRSRSLPLCCGPNGRRNSCRGSLTRWNHARPPCHKAYSKNLGPMV